MNRLSRRRIMGLRTTFSLLGLLALTPALMPRASQLGAQDMIRLRDLTIEDKAIPVRLLGYAVVNLLRRFGIQVPVEALKTRNVAAVLVTAEVSPYLRPGGRFEVHVSSLGDARSLRGGVLWMTPMQSEVGGQPLASAQGAVLMADVGGGKASSVENSSRIPTGGLIESDLPRPAFATSSKLLLRDPDVTMATRIATAINKELGDGTALVEDPGSIALAFKDQKDDHAAMFARIQDLRVQPQRSARLIIDSRDGTIIAGGDLSVGEATVSHGGITITIGATDTTAASPNNLRMAPGTPVTRIAAALHAVQAPPAEIAAIFESLRAIGAIAAEIVVR